jgi:ATP-dependent helicase HrpB
MDPKQLPIAGVLEEILGGLRRSGRVVLKAPPGAGKTTQVPQAILDSGLAGGGLTLLLEPRRVAARAAASFLARQRGEQVGETVGLSIRFETRRSARTRLMVVTEGVLTRRLVDDPLLDGVTCVILDEIHERSVHTDLALAFLRETLEVRDDLKVVAMSATLATEPVAAFLGGADQVLSEGRPHPVTVEYVSGRDDRRLEDRVASAVRQQVHERDGDVLVFLPGTPEIRRTAERLDGVAADVLPLHGALSTADQDKALRPAGGCRRVILATNIAETSVTIDGVKVVIDSGLEKRVRFDPARAVERLETVRISRFSSVQRAGRAGRTGPGTVVKLWSEAEDARLHDETAPEITRADPSPTLLTMLGFGADPRQLTLLAPIPDALLSAGEALLRMLRFVDDAGLTDRGRTALTMPVHPREAALLMEGAARGDLDRAALAAAVLGERDVIVGSLDVHVASDLELRLERLEDAVADGLDRRTLRQLQLDAGGARRVVKARDQLVAMARRAGLNTSATGDGDLTPSLLRAYPDRLAVRRSASSERARVVAGGGVKMHPSSGVRLGEWFVALDVGGAPDARGDLSVRVAHEVDEATLRRVLGDLLVTEEVAELSDDGRVRGLRQTRLGDVVLETKEGVKVGAEAIEAALLKAARKHVSRWFKPDDDTRRLLQRLRTAERLLDGAWPATDDDAVREWAGELVVGRRTLDELAKADLRALLLGKLGWERQQTLDAQLPDRWQVPSGSWVKLDYEAASEGRGPVVLAVRMQEMFGSTVTPRVAGQPVLLHLLAPNRRPAQVTNDLAGFWERTWAEVRKELRRRYPKHSWPEDPANADPERRPRRKRPS